MGSFSDCIEGFPQGFKDAHYQELKAGVAKAGALDDLDILFIEGRIKGLVEERRIVVAKIFEARPGLRVVATQEPVATSSEQEAPVVKEKADPVVGAKAAIPKIKYRNISAFRAGLYDGSFHSQTDRPQDVKISATRAGYGLKATDTKAYEAGYALGQQDKYIKAWKESKDAVWIAIMDKDIDNTDFDVDVNGSVIDKEDVQGVKKQAVAASDTGKIEDFGEKIGGARKDVWLSLKDALGKISDEEVKSLPLSKIWPAPDYEKLIRDGVDKETVSIIRALRDAIPPKPRKYVGGWADSVVSMRLLATNILDEKVTPAEVASKFRTGSRQVQAIPDQYELYNLVGHGKSLAGLRITVGEYTLYNGVEYKQPKIIWTVNKDAAATAMSNWPKEFSSAATREEAIDNFVKDYSNLDVADEKKKSSFVIWSHRSGDNKNKFFVGKEIGRNQVDLAGPFNSSTEARAYRTEHEAELESKLAKYKEIPRERRDTNNPRVGEDMRNGEDVTPEMFGNSFGFKGVEFGNWVEQKKRQDDLNNAFDALMDMAAILGVPPKALSLNGQLGLAFGARGSGGVHPAAAHYEHDKVVINLTKKEGAGSLGHEWWHALSSYFAKDFSKTNPRVSDMHESLGVDVIARGSRSAPFGDSVRMEMVDSFGKVLGAIKRTAMQARSSKLDERRTKAYWVTKPEMAARAFESYLIAKLQDQNASNDYLANIVDEATWKAAEGLGFELDSSYPYPTAGEVADIRAAFDHFFQTVKTKQTETGTAIYSTSSTSTGIDYSLASRYDVSGDAITDGENLGLKVHYGQAELAGELEEKIGDDTRIITWRMPDSLVRYDGKGRVVKAGSPKSDYELAERLSTIFNKKIVWSTIGDKHLINGVVVRDGLLSESIFIDVRSAIPAHSVLGHELLHFFELEHPESYKELFAAIEPMLQNVERYRARLKGPAMSDFRIKNEMVADLLGDNFNNEQFWKEVADNSGSKFKAISAKIRQWLSDLLRKITVFRSFSSDQLVTDVKAARSILARATARIIRDERQGAKAWSKQGGTVKESLMVGDYAVALRSQVEAARAIFSKLEEVAKIKFMGMKAQSVSNFLNKNGVKKEEMAAVGVNEWLAGKKPTDKVSREELLDFVRANMVEVEDVVLADVKNLSEDDQSEFRALDRKYIIDEMKMTPDEHSRYWELKGSMQKVIDGKNTHFGQYTEPGAEDGSYREFFVTAPGVGTEAEKKSLTEPLWVDGHGQYVGIKNPIVRIRFNEVQADGKRILRIEEMQGPSDTNQSQMPGYLKDNIYQIGTKRIIAYAKANGFDGVSFATKPGRSAGETQADRYSLEKKISRIEYTKTGPDQFAFQAYDLDGKQVMDNYEKSGEELERFVGKDVAKKIINNDGENTKDTANRGSKKVLSGLDLAVGGEGLRTLYDTQLPAMLEAYGKAKMVDVNIPGAESRDELASKVYGKGENYDNLPQISKDRIDLMMRNRQVGTSYLPITSATPASFPLFTKTGPTSTGNTIAHSQQSGDEGYWSGDGKTDGENLGLRVHNGQSELARQLEDAIQGGHKVTPWRMPDTLVRKDRKGRIDTRRSPGNDIEVAERIAGIFGKKIVWATIGDKYSINGVVVRNKELSDTVFLDVRSPIPAHMVLGHELSHFLETERPDIYKELFLAIEPMFQNIDIYKKKPGAKGLSEFEVRTEIIGDLLGDNFNNSQFWKDVADRSGGAFGRISQAIRHWLQSILDKLAGSIGFGSEKFVSDIVAARRLLAKATAEAMKRNKAGGAVKESLTTGDYAVAFSKQFGISVAEAQKQYADAVKQYGADAWKKAKAAGKTKLDERQFYQVRTPAFKEWFGDWENSPESASKVIDNDSGEPVVVYRGSNEQVNNYAGRGLVFFSGKKESAMRYGDETQEVFLNFKNPLQVDYEGKEDNEIGYDSEDAKNAGNDSLIASHTDDGYSVHDQYVVFSPNQIKSATGNTGQFSAANDDIRYSRKAQEEDEPSFAAPVESKKDTILYNAQNKFIDLFRIQDAIIKAGGTITEETDVRLAEELFHKRAETRTKDFLMDEVRPLMDELGKIDKDETRFESFLHARHAEEANEHLRLRNPNAEELDEMKEKALNDRDTLKNKQEVAWFVTAERELLVAEKDLALGNIDEAELAAIQSELTALKRDPLVKQYLLARERHVAMKKMKPYRGDNTNLSGMSDLEAQGVFASLPAEVRTKYEALANKIDAIIAKNRQTLVDYELESQDTVDAWAETFEHYIPLMREDMEEGMGIGSGFSVKGSATQSRTGSHRKVVDVLANILKQRETAITRGEKAIISKALVGLVEANPNKDFWSTEAPLMKMKIDPVTGLAQSVIDPSYKNQSHVVTVRMLDEKGKIVERSVVFNQHNKRALRLADALKNKDVEDLGTILGYSAKVTRFFSAMNTQYNIIFGVVNQVRDAGEAMLALTATPIAGHQKQIAKRMATIIPKLYQAVRAESKGTPLNTEIAKAWRELQVVGGTTGFRDMFETSADRTDSLRADIKAMSEGKPMRIFRHCKQWVSDYNDVLENSTRLATYMEGIAAGMTQKRAAQLAKDITINFNRKGKMATQAGAMYAFFNASMQGGEKLYRTMTGPGGKKILAGGLLLGAVQAVALAAAGFGDDEPPEFVRERSIVIPIGGKKYVTIPMPLGFHVIPNLSRIPTEFILNGMKDPGKSIGELISVFAEAFNPIGNAGMSVQSLAPTAIDPLIALSENKDWTGMPIAKEDFNRLKPTPGHTRGKTTASVFGDIVSRALNYMTGGNEYVPGLMSPTPDQIDFLVSQAFGGVGRETMKATQVAKSVATGEEVATHRIPLVGRFFGNANDSSSTSKQFYENIIKINRHDLEIDGMRADHINPTKYIADHPEARMIKFSEDEYRAIQKMQKTKRELMRNNGSKERIKMIELQLRKRMDRFNVRYEQMAG